MKKIIADPNIPLLEQFESIGNVIRVPGREWDNDLVRDADILLTRSVTKVNADLLKNSRVKFVGTATSGFDHIDRDYLDQNKIHFSYCPGSNAASVAEYILSSLFAVTKPDQKIQGMTAGVIGCGNVGSEVVKKLQAVGVDCILNDPPVQKQAENDQKYRSLQEVLSADIVTLHTPLTFDGEFPTYNLIAAKELQQMKPDVILINAARGGVVDETALLRRMEANLEMRAVIDCWENEPEIDPVLLEEVTIATPHIAGYSYDGKIKATKMLFDAVVDFFDLDSKWEGETLLDQKNTNSKVINPQKINKIQTSQRRWVLSNYDVRGDSGALKETLELTKEQRRLAFDQLRKDYPIRREFEI